MIMGKISVIITTRSAKQQVNIGATSPDGHMQPKSGESDLNNKKRSKMHCRPATLLNEATFLQRATQR